MVTTPPVPPGRPDEQDDPTGIRALLAGLGDPGPMPADLVDRINASIAAEQQSRSAAGDRTVVPLRRRRPLWAKVGLVAAAVAAVAVAVPAMLGTGPGELMASLSRGGSSSADDASAGAAKSAASGPEGAATGADSRAAGGTGAIALASTGTAYTSTELTRQARSMLSQGFSAASPLKADAATNPQGLRGCLTALGVAPWMPVVGDVGTYDGRPAVVALVSGDTGQSVYAVGRDCDATHPVVIAGPVPVP